jgi:hypothetical protein
MILERLRCNVFFGEPLVRKRVEAFEIFFVPVQMYLRSQVPRYGYRQLASIKPKATKKLT